MANTKAAYAQEVIVPAVEELEIETGGLVCQVDGCPGRFSGSSQLRMHMEKHHRKRPLSVKMDRSLYCCPVSGCDRSRGGTGKPFPRLGQLKQHYQRVHGVKKHSCEKCGKQFSLRDVYSRHIAECGKDITCPTCGAKFLTKNSLFKHTRRKHQDVVGKTSKDKPEADVTTAVEAKSSDATVLLPLPPVQIVLKQVVKLSKQVSVSTQTEDSDEVAGADAVPGRCAPLFEQSSSSLLDFSTQTEADEFPQGGSLHSSFDFNDLATQTDLSELLGFGTRSASSQTCLTQPGEEMGQYLHSSDQSGDDSILKEAVHQLSGKGLSSSVLPTSLSTSPGLECVGTQTSSAGPGCYEGATQTSPEDFFCPLDDESRIDFGTQTMDWLSDVASLLPAPSCYGEEETSQQTMN